MENIINNALKELSNANYSGFFEELDKVAAQMPNDLLNLYNTHKKKFIAEGVKWDSAQQLEVFAKALKNPSQNKEEGSDKTDRNINANTYIEKIDGDRHTFNF